MASIILTAAGSAIGGSFAGFLGFSGAAIGGAIGSIIGTAIDARLIAALGPSQRIDGPRLEDVRVTSATEGAVIPRVYGRMRVGGNIIWATDFREESKTTRQGGGGKGGGGGVRVTEYSYFASFAVALCEGPIGGIGRIWADGKPFDVPGAVIRLHRGTEDQLPDPHIEALDGAGNAPAYRGTAYAVFENLPLERFGNRLPQLSFEVFCPSDDPASAEQLVQAVNIIPSAGEFIYATEPITRAARAGESIPENVNSTLGVPDFIAAIDQLEACAPNCRSVSLVVSWFGVDLRAGTCQIRPGVEVAAKTTTPRSWSVNGLGRGAAHLVSRDAKGDPIYGGTPADFAVVQAIQELKARGFRVTFYPFLLMDIPEGNELPNPYSDSAAEIGQPVLPWRGRITCSPAPGFAGTVDKTATAGAQVASFFGNAQPSNFSVSGTSVAWTGPAGDWGLRRMILHYAHLCAVAGGVDAFLIGTEMRGLTHIRSGAATYPAVQAFRDLAGACRSILGTSTKISYAADWSEYFGHQPGDGSGDVFFHLDPLWADGQIDFIGIDNYMPLSDWRDGDHADAQAGWGSIYDIDYLRANIEGGEGFDWFYASEADRTGQVRTPISDGAAGKPWVFRYKDLRSWWSEPHFDRPGGVESATPTAWVPRSKPIRFTEAGAPAVDRGTNQPNVFFDPKSSESFLPYFSRGFRDDLIQRRYIEALYPYWADPTRNPVSPLYGGPMIEVDEISIWTWDARPFPAFPARDDVWTDGANWRQGHWLGGRLGGIGLAELVRALCRRGGLPEGLIDTDRLAAAVPGYLVSGIESARGSIEPLSRFFGFDGMESEGALRFIPRGGRPAAVIDPERLVAARRREAEDMTLTRGQQTELPLALKWRVVTADADYGGLTVEARRITVDTARIGAEGFPIAMSQGQADRHARRALFEDWIGREEASFALPPSMLALDPADVVTLLHDGRAQDYALARLSDGEFRRIEARRTDPAIYDLPPGPDRTPSAAIPTVPGPPQVLLMNLPQLAEAIPAARPYAAVYARPWYGQAAIWRSATEDGFELLDVATRPARIGTLVFDFFGGRAHRFDRGNELWIDLPTGALASVSDQALFAGQNAVAVESAPGIWEIVQFPSAELVAPGRYRCSRLLRGQLGTEDAIGDPAPAGAPVVVLDAALQPLSITEADIGLPWNWRVGPASASAGAPVNTALTFTPEGAGLRPFSPVHLRGQRQGDGAILITWIRRTRAAAGDSWVLAEVPLGEEREEYEIEILDAGGAVLRTITGLTTPAVTYTAQQMAEDFGGPITSLQARVFQIGALGRGAALDAVIQT